jgi:hypothetical protein
MLNFIGGCLITTTIMTVKFKPTEATKQLYLHVYREVNKMCK